MPRVAIVASQAPRRDALRVRLTAAGVEVVHASLTLEEAERVFIEKTVARHGGDVRLAADQLGMSRSALYRRLQQYGVKN